jgi:hypothetical protein
VSGVTSAEHKRDARCNHEARHNDGRVDRLVYGNSTERDRDERIYVGVRAGVVCVEVRSDRQILSRPIISDVFSLLLSVRCWVHSRAALQLEMVRYIINSKCYSDRDRTASRLETLTVVSGSGLPRVWADWRTALRHRSTGDGHRLASPRLPSVLKLDEPPWHGPEPVEAGQETTRDVVSLRVNDRCSLSLVVRACGSSVSRR